MAKKTTKAQRTQRIRAIYELLLVDATRGVIVQYCSQQWEVSDKTADNYVKAASELIAEEAARIRKNAFDKHLAQRASMRHKALKVGNSRLAFDILKDETKLLDLYPSDKQEVTGAGGGPIETRATPADFSALADDELETFIALSEKLNPGKKDAVHAQKIIAEDESTNANE